MTQRGLDLRDVVEGSTLPDLALPPISRTTLALFGPASGSLNPIHLDLDVARSAGLDDVFAHGMLSMAYLGRLLTRWIDQRMIRSFSVRFSAITPVHVSPVCRGHVMAVRTDDGERVADIAMEVVIDGGIVTVEGVATVALGTARTEQS